MDQQDTLAEFLLDNNLISLLQPLTDQEADLDFLLQANDHELSLLVPGVVNKGKLRLALARYKELMLQEKPVHVTPPFRAGHLTSDSDLSTWTLETSETNLVDPGSNCSPGLPTTVDTAPPAAESSSTSRKPDTFLSPVIVSNASSGFNSPGITVIDTGCAVYPPTPKPANRFWKERRLCCGNQKTILENTSAGKPILSRTFLTTKDRKILTAIIVEAEIRKLKKISDPIRKEVWENWTTEIITLFPGETKAVYYSPFRILDGRVLQASGLIVNRLITVRRRLVPAENRRSKSRSSDDSSDSSTKKKARTSTEPVRVRPLPESFNSKKIGDQEESGESYLQWLKASSSPRDLVNSKWKNCLRGRIDILKESDHITYFKEFPALQCPWGYELLASDFDEIYPNTKEKFEEKFPILKGRLLALLDEKSQQLTRADISIQSVLELGTLGEEQANVAAFLSIPLLLKQMHTIPVRGTRKPWNPSRAEVSSAFLSLVASSSDVETHRLERQAKLIDKKEEDSAATEMCYKCCDSCKITLSFLGSREKMDFGHLLLVAEEAQRRRDETKIVRRHLRERNNPMDLEDSDFMRLFRISREIAFVVIESIGGDIRRIRSNGLPVHVVVLTAVRFYAVGSYQRCIGQEYNLALGQRTVSKVVKEVSEAIVRRLMPVYIRFPSTAADRALIADGFLQKHGVPDCLGCIDCTHVAIVTPYDNDPNDPSVGYKNRKGNYTINTQFVCDSNCRLINVNARFPGSTHDQYIFNNSTVKGEMARLTSNRVGRFYLIGDSGYAKEPYMITPILPSPPEGSSDSIYNHKITQMRNCVERTNGIIKAIFRCLRKDRVLHYQPKRAAFIILSCCTIYNMMHHFRYPLPEIEIQDPAGEDQDPMEPISTGSSRALQRQNEILNIIINLQ